MSLSRASNEGLRLAKRVAELRQCSRREAEQYIEGGWVRVNGQVVEEPQFRVLDQQVEIDPQASLLELTPVTLLLHKPPDCLDALALLSPKTHLQNDPSQERILKCHFQKLTAPVALENAASGLVVFTQDWRVARKLTEDAGEMEQEFLVDIAGQLAPEVLARLHQAARPSDSTLPGMKVSLNSNSNDLTRLRFALKGWQPGLIARWCEKKDLEILAIKRLRIGRVGMSQLPVGQWRYLQGYERF